MTVVRVAAGTLVAAGAALGLAAASHVRVPMHAGDAALLRVAFSARPERIETCRTPDAEELAALAPHMRQQVVCEGSTARYRLEVLRDADTLLSSVVRGGGLRHDRQLYVLRELAVPSGPATVEVRLTRIEEGATGGRPATGRAADAVPSPAAAGEPAASRDSEARRRRLGDEVPPSLTLRATVRLAPREVMLVTYDRSTRRLRTVRTGP